VTHGWHSTDDGCANHANPTVKMSGQNVGDLLNAAGVTWGWFEGGFAPTHRNADGSPVCGKTHNNIGGISVTDYNPHHTSPARSTACSISGTRTSRR
jgi:phospholipase C